MSHIALYRFRNQTKKTIVFKIEHFSNGSIGYVWFIYKELKFSRQKQIKTKKKPLSLFTNHPYWSRNARMHSALNMFSVLFQNLQPNTAYKCSYQQRKMNDLYPVLNGIVCLFSTQKKNREELFKQIPGPQISFNWYLHF